MAEKYPMSYVLVDDDEDDRFLMKMALQQVGRPLPIHEFANGQELLNYLSYDSFIQKDNRYHWLIVMDVNMPIMDGISAVKNIRQHEQWQEIPILMLSTANDSDIISEALESGANGYIVKPTSMEKYSDIFDEFFAPWLQSYRDS